MGTSHGAAPRRCRPDTRHEAAPAAEPDSRLQSPRASTVAMPQPLFNKNLDTKLLKLVKENPILYNSRHSSYLNFDAREVVWQKIGDALNRPALACKSRWVNIRDMMRRKIRTRQLKPNSIKRQYKYKYEEEMAFMIPFFKEITTDHVADYAEFYQDGDCEVEMPSEVFVDSNVDSNMEFEEMKPALTFKKRPDETSRDFNDSVFQEASSSDPLDVFLLTIGSTLRKLSPLYLNQAKSKIFQVVQDFELQQLQGSEADTSSNR